MADVTSASYPVRLQNGEIVIVTPFTQRELMSIFKTIQQKNLNSLVEAIPVTLDAEHYKAAFSEAIRISKEFDINRIGEALQQFADVEIIETMLLYAIQKNCKDAQKKVKEIMDNATDFENVMNAINGGTGGGEESDELPPANVQS